MVENADQIKDRIDAQRDELGENLNEIERRFRNAADWRSHVENRPWLALGVALGAGFALGSLLFRRDDETYDYSSYDDDSKSKAYAGSSAYSAYSAGSPGDRYRSNPPSRDYSSTSESETSTGADRAPKLPAFRGQAKRFSDNLDTVLASLLSVGQSKLHEVLNEAIPGFSDHYERTSRERGLYSDEGSTQGRSSYTDRETEYQAGRQRNESGFGSGETSNYPGNTGASTMGSQQAANYGSGAAGSTAGSTQQQPTNTF